MHTVQRRFIVALVAMCCLMSAAKAQDRLPPIPTDKLTDAQKQVADDFAKARGAPLSGPWPQFLRSPELMTQTLALSDYVRLKTSIEPRINELVALVVAREWTQQFQWAIHYNNAKKAGVKDDIINAIAEGRRPDVMVEDEGIAYDVATEILHEKRVSDTTWNRAVAKFGERGVLDLLSTIGYFTSLSVVMNATHPPVPNTGAAPLQRYPE
jgi:4-carboxymuconolactone decarboxylase